MRVFVHFSENMVLNLRYPLTFYGFLKVFRIIIVSIVLICIVVVDSSVLKTYSSSYFVMAEGIQAIIIACIFLLFYSLGLPEKWTKFSWPKLEMALCLLFGMVLLICSVICMIIAAQVDSDDDSSSKTKFALAAAFGVAAALAHLFEAMLQYSKRKKDLNREKYENIEK